MIGTYYLRLLLQILHKTVQVDEGGAAGARLYTCSGQRLMSVTLCTRLYVYDDGIAVSSRTASKF